jgi:hypothetical protein
MIKYCLLEMSHEQQVVDNAVERRSRCGECGLGGEYLGIYD